MAGIRIGMVLWLLAYVLSASALAHKPSDSYLKITGGGEHLIAQWDISLKDLEYLIGLDADQNGEITWGELKAQRQALETYALGNLQITADGRECDPQVSKLLVTQHSDGTYAVLDIVTDCPGNAAVLNIYYSLFFNVDPTHRGLVLYNNGSIASTYVLSPSSPSVEIKAGEQRLWTSFTDYVREGSWHIWIGFDHVLFLLALLLPAVLVKRDQNWQPVGAFRPACMSVVKIVTMFTLAHSITLWLAVMEYVTLPSQLVEATIAFSIAVTALNNLYPVVRLSGWAIAFGFGLVHGFGFANVLLDLGLSSVTLALSLLGFNVGVELGQIAIVLVFLPMAYMLRKTPFYLGVVLRGGSFVVAIVAMLWMYERVFNVEIIYF